ncbi:MAG: hypothetical protein QXX30_03075, partial [Candidatus Aenigmatarchaeota archaeon]
KVKGKVKSEEEIIVESLKEGRAIHEVIDALIEAFILEDVRLYSQLGFMNYEKTLEQIRTALREDILNLNVSVKSAIRMVEIANVKEKKVCWNKKVEFNGIKRTQDKSKIYNSINTIRELNKGGSEHPAILFIKKINDSQSSESSEYSSLLQRLVKVYPSVKLVMHQVKGKDLCKYVGVMYGINCDYELFERALKQIENDLSSYSLLRRALKEDMFSKISKLIRENNENYDKVSEVLKSEYRISVRPSEIEALKDYFNVN